MFKREREKVNQFCRVFNRAVDYVERGRRGEELGKVERDGSKDEGVWSFVRTVTGKRTREDVDEHERGAADCVGRGFE